MDVARAAGKEEVVSLPATLDREEIAREVHQVWAERGDPMPEDYVLADWIIDLVLAAVARAAGGD